MKHQINYTSKIRYGDAEMKDKKTTAAEGGHTTAAVLVGV